MPTLRTKDTLRKTVRQKGTHVRQTAEERSVLKPEAVSELSCLLDWSILEAKVKWLKRKNKRILLIHSLIKGNKSAARENFSFCCYILGGKKHNGLMLSPNLMP